MSGPDSLSAFAHWSERRSQRLCQHSCKYPRNPSQQQVFYELARLLTWVHPEIMTHVAHFNLSASLPWPPELLPRVLSLHPLSCCTGPCLLIPSQNSITQGLLFGIGILLMDNPLMIILNTWFVRRRGIAYGILFGVCDLIGVGWSFLASYLLLHLGLRKTMLIFAAIVFAVSGPCLFFLRERGAKSVFSPGFETPTPQTPRRGSGTPNRYEKYAIITKYSTKRFYHCWLFYLLAAANLAHACAYYLPFSKF